MTYTDPYWDQYDGTPPQGAGYTDIYYDGYDVEEAAPDPSNSINPLFNYTILYASIDGEVLGELPADSFNWTDALNSPGSFTVTLPLDPYPGQGGSILTSETLVPGRTKVFVVRNAEILWGGLLWTASFSMSSGTATYNGEGFMSYFRRRVADNASWTATDQDTIARGLIEQAQAVTFGSLGILTPANPHGVTRDRNYLASDRNTIGELVENLAAVRGGFDFHFTHQRQPTGRIVSSFNTLYPTTGRETDHVFELGGNVESLDYSVDGTNLATKVAGFGGVDSLGNPLSVTVEDSEMMSVSRYPLLEDTVTHHDVTKADTLTAHANRRLDRGSKPIPTITIHVLADEHPSIGSYFVGDKVRVRGQYGLLDIDDTYRIVEISVGVSNKGEDVTIQLVDVGLFQ